MAQFKRKDLYALMNATMAQLTGQDDFNVIDSEWGIDVYLVHYDARHARVERFTKAVWYACAYGCGNVWLGIDVDIAEAAERA